MSTWVLSPGQPGLAGSSGIQLGKHDDRNVKTRCGAVAIRSERSIYQGILRNTASGLIIVLTSRACWLNWGMQSWQALRCHIGS